MNISCVILNYNDYSTTKKLVDKIKHYTCINTIVIVDNHSTNDSWNVLNQYKSSNIHVLKSPKNGGYGYGNNIGIQYAIDYLKVDYILIANPDVVFEEDIVAQLLKGFSNNKIALIAPTPLSTDLTIQEPRAWKLLSPLKDFLSSSYVLSHIFHISPQYALSYFSDYISDVDVVQGAFYMIKADLMMKYGMFDENFFLYGEEQILSLKFKRAGYKIALLNKSFYIHNHSSTISKFYSYMKIKRLQLDSKLKYIKDYHQMSKFKHIVCKMVVPLILVENHIIFLLKRRGEM